MPAWRHLTPAMKTVHRLLVLVALTVALPLSAQSPAAGSISGRVSDASSKLALAGARVSVVGTALETFTSTRGDYLLSEVPAGVHTVVVSYLGYAEATRPASVAAGRATALDFVIGGEAVRMDALVITGSLVGQARAVNQQRAAETLSNFVAADEIGRFPDQNAAESMQRIPGLALYRDQGEGRYIVVRGIRPDLNSVKINGVSMASPERGDRIVALDVMPTDTLGAVEVTKAITPDMDADGLGGAINLKTRSAFDATGRQLQFSAQGQYNNLRDRLSSKFNGTWADTFNNGTVGVIFSPTWQARRFGSNNFEEAAGWTLRPVPGNPTQQAWFFNELANREYEITRTRYGANGALEFKPDADSFYYVRGTYAKFTDAELRFLYHIPFSEGTLTALNDSSATVTDVRRERLDIRIRRKIQEIGSVVAGGEKTIGAWRLDGRAAYSEGKENRPDELTVRFRKGTRGSNWTYSFANGAFAPKLTQTGANLADPSLYNEINRVRLVNAPGKETEFNVGGNARYKFTLADARPAYLKGGLQFRQKEKMAENETVDHAAPASFTLAANNERQTNTALPYSPGLRNSAPKLGAAFFGNRSAFTATRLLAESEQDDWTSNEDVFAAYGMGGVTIDQFNVIGGVRHERTRYDARGNEISGTTVRSQSRGRTYEQFLPGLFLRYDLAKQTVLRASVSNTLARPTFDDAAFRRTVNPATSRVTEGNPRLKPLEAVNWDASVEHYLPALGLVSAAVFAKDIDNFTYQRVIPGGDPATGYELTTFVNGDQGKIRGLEVAWQQQLRFLPAPFDGLGLMANFTWTDSEAKYPTRAGEKLDFIGQSKGFGNLALTYEKRGFFVRVAVNVRSPRLREDEPLGADANTDRWVDRQQQLDVTASYRLSRNWEVFAEGLNLNDEPFRVYFGKNSHRFVQFEEYGWSANFGVRWKL
jgi:TonB-dependent receptor